MSEKTPDNITYGDGTAAYRMRFKKMLEEHNSRTNKNNKNKNNKNKKNESAIEKITRILYGGGN